MITLCTQCGFNNPPGMRFCGNCGTRLLAAALTTDGAGIDTSAPPLLSENMGVMMGADLVDRLRKAGVESAGQRRNVTILFTDLTGYTSLSERMDSEDLYHLVQQYIHVLLNNVYKYEGIVDKLTGDGLMALFGAPIAHENNAERAVRAAIDMQNDVIQLSKELKKKLGVDLSMRVGLHSGTVIVGGVGSNLLMDYTAIGDTVNLAHRIEESAPPGGILISEAVHKQTKMLFDCQQVSVLTPKGIAGPVAAWRVIGLKEKPGRVRGIEGLRAPMVGRDHEFGILKQSLTALLNRKKGQFVVVTGEAGLGKSRLTSEFKTSLSQYSIRILEGQSLAYRRSISYWIFLDVIYNYLALPPNTPPLQVRERLTQLAYQAMGGQASEVIPYLEHLLSLPYSDVAAGERLRYLDAGQLRQQIFLAVRDLLVIESYRLPMLLILEDLHWADEASLELLRFLIESLRQAPIFILAISRQILPGPMAKAVELAKQHLGDRTKLIELQNLSQDQSEQLFYQLLTIPELPESLREQIIQRASGIPFYLEEILRMLIDEAVIQREDDRWILVPGTDVSNLGVPDTLQELILARFDRLEPDQRRILQVASVIGKNFSQQVLNSVLASNEPDHNQEVLASLVERDFIQPRPGEFGEEYTFRHILMSDAIYGTILRRDRSKIHGQVGETIEILYADRLEGQIELLANHYRWSLRLDRALHYLILAGQKATRNNVNEQARQHYVAALELMPKVEHLPYQELQVQMGLGDVLMFFGEYPVARQNFQDALKIIRSLDPGLYAEEHSALYRKVAKTFERQGDYDMAINHLANAEAALDQSSLPLNVERSQIRNDIGLIHFRRGNFSESQQLLEKALELVETTDAYDVIASIYNRLGGVAYNQGDWDRAVSFLRKSIAIREEIGDVVGLASSFINLGLLEIEMGEFDNALENLTRSYWLKTRLGQAEGIALALNNLGWLRIQRGELDDANKALSEAHELAKQIGYTSLLRQILKNFGELHLCTQDWDKAREVLNQIIPDLIELGANDQLLDTYRLLGEVSIGAGEVENAVCWSQKAQELITQLGDEFEELAAVQRGEMRRFRGMLAIAMGDLSAAGKYLRESAAIFQKLRSRLYQGRVTYQLGKLAEAQGDRLSAQLRYREAVLLFQSIGAKLEEKYAEEARIRQSV